MKAKILIGTPVYDEQVLVPYHASMMRLANHWRRRDITFDAALLGTSLISHARNAMATLVLNDASFTHLLFVDADMGFAPSLIDKMLAFDRPVVGCVYPARSYSPESVARLARERSGEEYRDAALEYICGSETFLEGPEGRPIIEGDFVQVRRTGTGVMLLKREALEAMTQRFPDLWSRAASHNYRVLGLAGPVFQAFEAVREPSSGLFVGEDLSFCLRWVEGCKGEIWACYNEAIQHVGRARFAGSYEHKMRYEGLL